MQMREMPTDVELLVDLDQHLGNLDASHLRIRLAGQLFDPLPAYGMIKLTLARKGER